MTRLVVVQVSGNPVVRSLRLIKEDGQTYFTDSDKVLANPNPADETVLKAPDGKPADAAFCPAEPSEPTSTESTWSWSWFFNFTEHPLLVNGYTLVMATDPNRPQDVALDAVGMEGWVSYCL